MAEYRIVSHKCRGCKGGFYAQRKVFGFWVTFRHDWYEPGVGAGRGRTIFDTVEMARAEIERHKLKPGPVDNGRVVWSEEA